ncbi:MAG: PAS-domain containing protein, partial [Alphaproteobacteria bacterium]|nr:PAS-domain containing protein [Alphaproteobacteria bacterium]
MSTSTQLPNAHDSESEPQGRLLVVDDDRDFAESLAELLELRGYATKSKYEFRDALTLAKTFEPDVVLVDIRLGRRSGLDFIADLKERHPAIDCILLTAHGDVDTAIEAVRRGACDYLLKPLDLNYLLISLDRCFEKRRLEREKQAAEAALACSEERYRDFIEAASDWAWEMNAEQRFTSLAGYSANAIGIGSEDVVGRTLVELGMRGIDEETSTRQLQVFKERKPFRDSIGTVLSPDGRLRYINVSGKPIFDAAGEFLGFRGTANDVTKLMEREKALRESEAKFRQLAEGSIAGIHIHRKFRTIVANQAYADIFGYSSPDEISALEDVLQLIAPHERDRLEGYRARRMAGKTAPSRYEYQGLRKDGTVIWLESHVRAVDWEGEPATQTTLIDITKQHEAERAQQESEQAATEAQTLLLEAMESSSDGIAIYDSDDRLKLYNEAFRNGIQSGISDLIEPGVRYEQLVRAAVEQNLVSVPDGDVESYVRMRLEQHRRADSSVEIELPNNRWMLARDRRLPGGGFVGTRSDITDLKRARLALKESRRQAADALAMLTEAMESNPDAVAIFDANDRLTHYNEAYRTGFSAELSKSIKPGARFQDILRTAMERNLYAIPDGDKEAYFNDSLELHRQGGRSLEIELTDGRWFLFSERRMPGGGTVSTRSDITERRRAELALRENDQRLRTMIENVPGVVWRHILHADGSVTFPFLSPHHVKWLGIDFDAAMKDTQVIFERLHPDDRDGWNAAWGKSAKSLAPFHREVRIFGSANDIRWFRVRALPQKLPNGDTQWDAVGIDVTDEKRAAEVRDRMFAALENLTDAIALFGPDDRLVYTNPRYIEYNEKARSVVKPGNTFEQILRGNVQLGRFPEAAGREEDWIAERMAARRNLPYAAERKVDSEWFDVREAALPDGSTVLLIIDITERKAAEAALLRNEASLAAAQRIAHLGSWELEVETGTATWSAESYRIFGYQPGAIDPSRDLVKAAVHPADRDAFAENFRRAYADSPYNYDIEYRIVRSDGSQRFIHSKAELLRNEAGKPIKLIGTVHDISERKQAEAEATEAHHRLSDAIESISEGFILYDVDERFVLCNKKYREFYPKISDVLVPGAKVEDIVRATIVRGQFADNIDGDAWIRMRLAQYRSAQGAHEQHLSDGRWLLATESRTTEGGFVGIRTDITERKRAEEALKKNEQQLTLITENAPAMISYIGQDERYRFANSAYENLVGVSPQQLLGESIRDFWGEAIYARVGGNVKRVLAGETVNFEYTLPGKAGGKIYL